MSKYLTITVQDAKGEEIAVLKYGKEEGQRIISAALDLFVKTAIEAYLETHEA